MGRIKQRGSKKPALGQLPGRSHWNQPLGVSKRRGAWKHFPIPDEQRKPMGRPRKPRTHEQAVGDLGERDTPASHQDKADDRGGGTLEGSFYDDGGDLDESISQGDRNADDGDPNTRRTAHPLRARSEDPLETVRLGEEQGRWASPEPPRGSEPRSYNAAPIGRSFPEWSDDDEEAAALPDIDINLGPDLHVDVLEPTQGGTDRPPSPFGLDRIRNDDSHLIRTETQPRDPIISATKRQGDIDEHAPLSVVEPRDTHTLNAYFTPILYFYGMT
ncbi:hypothetical protein IAU60_006934 [Kwoniella sp. DSM 27419]